MPMHNPNYNDAMESKSLTSTPEKPIFEDLNFQPLPQGDSTCPLRAVYRHETSHSVVCYLGAFFQFTPADRNQWNQLVLHKVLPDVSMGLGARWTRITGHLPESSYECHMPSSSAYAKEHCKPLNRPTAFTPSTDSPRAS